MGIKLLSILLLLAGTVLTVNGGVVNTDDILASAGLAVNQANIHQLATALEFYYLDHNSYPHVTGGSVLINELEKEGYLIGSEPADADSFDYQVQDNGQDYLLKLKSE
jgi:hypothetical protein